MEAHGLRALFVTEHTHLPIEYGPPPWGSRSDRSTTERSTPSSPWPSPPNAPRRSAWERDLPRRPARSDRPRQGRRHGRPRQRRPVRIRRGLRLVQGGSRRSRRRLRRSTRRRRRARGGDAGTVAAGPDTVLRFGVRFGPAHAHPKPVTLAGPPVLLGAPLTRRSLRHLVEWADGWIPSDRPTLLDDLQAVGDGLRAAGRDPATFSVTVVGTRARHRVEQLAEAGVSACSAGSPPALLTRCSKPWRRSQPDGGQPTTCCAGVAEPARNSTGAP